MRFRSKWSWADVWILQASIWIFLGFFSTSDEGYFLSGIVLIILGVLLFIARIAFIVYTKLKPNRKSKWSEKNTEFIYLGLLMLNIGYLMLIANLGIEFPIVLMVCGGVLILGTALFVYLIKSSD